MINWGQVRRGIIYVTADEYTKLAALSYRELHGGELPAAVGAIIGVEAAQLWGQWSVVVVDEVRVRLSEGAK